MLKIPLIKAVIAPQIRLYVEAHLKVVLFPSKADIRDFQKHKTMLFFL